MAEYRIRKNRNMSSSYDQHIIEIEGRYESLEAAMDAIHGCDMGFQEITTPDGSIWIYPDSMIADDVITDIAGYHAIAIIEEIEGD